MKIFHLNELTGELIGEGIADVDPLEKGNWLIPAHATNVQPPDVVEGLKRHFIAGGWEYKEIPPPTEPVQQPSKIIEIQPTTA